MRVLVIGMAAAIAACTASNVECLDDASCNLASGGRCVANASTGATWCAYPDEGCGSGLRWSDFDVGDGVGGTCLAAAPGDENHTLTITIDGPGIVTSEPAGIDCAAGTCTAEFRRGTVVLLDAAPAAQTAFAGFTGACTGTHCAVTMDSDKVIRASFVSSRCEPNRASCSGDVLIECDASGKTRPTACALGCDATSSARCLDVLPSNGGTSGAIDMTTCLDGAELESNYDIPDAAVIDTDSGQIATPSGGVINIASTEIAAPPNGVAVRCFRVGELTTGDVIVVGTRALAIRARGKVTVNGTLSVSARGTRPDGGVLVALPGPGDLPSCGGRSGDLTAFLVSGSGGGGFGTRGGDGGSTINRGDVIVGGAGGEANGTPELVPLRGGCGAGGHAVRPSQAPTFRLGGGAVQIVSRREIAVGPEGGVAANGWGGTRREGNVEQMGGGSGGGILLEAPVITLAEGARIVANGGGGGGASAGEPGRMLAEQAAGGPANSAGTIAAGGAGGALDLPGSAGGNGPEQGRGGGGGGGAGRIRINTHISFVAPDAVVISPVPSIGQIRRR